MNKNITYFIILFLSLVLSYFFILENQFLGDDINRLVQTPELNSLYKALTGSLADRPLLQLIMWVEKVLFGLDPFRFRLVNLLFHTLTCFQLYLLITEIYVYRGNILTEASRRWVWFGTFAFALHPLHSQSLYIVIQGGVVLAGLFGIWSLRYFFKWLFLDEKNSLVVCSLTLLTAVLFKPIVSFFPFYYIFVAYCFKNTHPRSLKGLIPTFIVLLAPFVYLVVFKKNTQNLSLGVLDYFLIQTEVLFTYFRLILIPVNLKYLYDFNPPINQIFNLNWLYLLIHVSILVTAWKLIKDQFYRALVFGIYFSFIPESSFFPIEHVAFEHRTFFALSFVFIILTLFALEKKMWEKKRSISLVGVLLLCYIVFIQTRNFQIKPDTNWFYHSLENSQNYDDFNIPGVVFLMEMGKFEEAKSIIKLYKAQGKNSLGYQMLYAMEDYYPKKDLDSLIRIGRVLAQPEMSMKQRLLGNTFMILKIGNQSVGIATWLLLEDLMFLQMDTFKKNAKIFYGPMDFYLIVSTKIISTPDAIPERVLRIKATQVKYFKRRFKNLENDIDNALKQEPTSQFLIEAKALLISSGSN